MSCHLQVRASQGAGAPSVEDGSEVACPETSCCTPRSVPACLVLTLHQSGGRNTSRNASWLTEDGCLDVRDAD